MKRSFIAATALLAAVCFCLSACGTSDNTEKTDSDGGTAGLSYSLTADGSAYVCDGIGEATAKEIIIAPTHEGLPVTEIGAWAFYGGEFTSITIPESVTAINEGAFSTCNYITEVTVPDGVTTISESAFHSCASLKSVKISENVTNIGDMAFENCVSLTEITSLNGVTHIGTEAFGGCEKLSSFTVPAAMTKINPFTFFECYRLSEVVIPSSVTDIGRYSFYGCTAISRVYYAGSEEELNAIAVAEGNDDFKENIYVYSESAPAQTDSENIVGYWYYTDSGRIEIWR